MVDRPQYTVLDKDDAAVQKPPMSEGLTDIRYKIIFTWKLYTVLAILAYTLQAVWYLSGA